MQKESLYDLIVKEYGTPSPAINGGNQNTIEEIEKAMLNTEFAKRNKYLGYRVSKDAVILSFRLTQHQRFSTHTSVANKKFYTLRSARVYFKCINTLNTVIEYHYYNDKDYIPRSYGYYSEMHRYVKNIVGELQEGDALRPRDKEVLDMAKEYPILIHALTRSGVNSSEVIAYMSTPMQLAA